MPLGITSAPTPTAANSNFMYLLTQVIVAARVSAPQSIDSKP